MKLIIIIYTIVIYLFGDKRNQEYGDSPTQLHERWQKGAMHKEICRFAADDLIYNKIKFIILTIL